VQLKERPDIRLAAAELDEGRERIAASAARENAVEKALRRLPIEGTGFPEGREGIGGQDLGPLVAVVAGGIAASKDVREAVRVAVPLGHARDRDRRTHLGQQGVGAPAALRVVLGVHAHVEQRELHLAERLESGLETAGGDELALLRLGERGAVVHVRADPRPVPRAARRNFP